MKIWVDDIRTPPDDSWVWRKNSGTTIGELQHLKSIGVKVDVMSLDHDLGGDDTSRAIVLWMCENEWWPESVMVHSQNPVGSFWLRAMIERYSREG